MDNKKRTTIQAIATILQNANFKGFFTGQIYRGDLKQACVPGLNCYSCPGALGSCPVGSLQSSLSSMKFKFPYYIVGLLIFFGVLLGRIICGFLCPFGLLEDLLNKIPFPKKIKTFKGDKWLRYLKYVVLILLVIILPICVKLTPFFCKYLCPSGTIAGILLGISDSLVAGQFGMLFTWKAIILAIIVVSSIIIYRPFCRYLCPLGAIYGLFNKVSVFQMSVDKNKCTNCGRCASTCDMCVDPSKTPNHIECIRCGKCIDNCPETAITLCSILKANKN